MKVIVSDGHGGRVRHFVVHAPAGARLADLASRLGYEPSPPAAVDVPLQHGQELWPLPVSRTPAAAGTGSALRGPALVVAAGPDAGGTLPLPPGRWVTVGRAPACDLVIADPSLSRRHVRVRLDRDCVQVEDLASTNGVTWEEGGEASVWRAGDRLLLGRSALVLEPRPPAPASVVPQDGHLQVVPWRRERPAPRPVDLTSPPEPVRRTVRRPNVWTWALPLAVAVTVALVLRMPWLLLFGLLGPAMVFGHHLGDRRAARDEHRDAVAAHRRQLEDLDLAAENALRAELARRRETDPGVLGVTAALSGGPSTRLWECSGEPLSVVLGEAVESADVIVDGARLRHERAPLTVDVRPALVITGPPRLRDALARSLVLQLAARHPPDTFTLAVDPDRLPDGDWDLLAWLPHTRLGGHRERDVRWGTDLRLVDDVREAPTDVPRVLLLGPHDAVLQRPGLPDRPFRPTLLRLGRARTFAGALAPMRPRQPAGADDPDAGRPTALGELVPWPGSPGEAARGWSRPGLAVPLGLADGGPVTVDLAVDGPHALVAGTTGSGKSELLRSLVVGLALHNSPADLSLLLVDYKGGSSLGACAGLPHVTGLVTDLDPHLADRVLLSLQSELRRREQVLHAAGVRDVRDPGQPGLPRLVVVIDEFRVLAEEVPQVMDGLVRVAAVGRSLGVHLVLATQRPAGVVGADLRANVNLRVALRVRDIADSYDVLECADAAALPEGRPGLALLRTGASPPRSVQVAVARPAPRARATDGWCITEADDLWAARSALETTDTTEADEDDPVLDLAATLAAAAEATGLQAPTVWLPPLPEDLSSDPAADTGWAVADLPGEQRQPPLTWSGDHHIGIVGASRSGRTTALLSLLARSSAWFVALDLGRALDAGWAGPTDPRCCAWVLPDDRAHALRVLDLLLTLVQARQGGPLLPRDPLVLAIDGWDRLVDQLGQVEGGRGIDVAQRILREGPGVGVTGVVTGDRSLLLGTMATLLPETWMLHLNDPADLLLTRLQAAQVPRHQPPGRAVRARDGVVAQVVRPDPPGGRPPPGPTPPLRCLPLPRLAHCTDPTVWAVGGDEAAAVDLPVGPVLVLGPPGSGRSRTLAALAAAAGGTVLLVEGGDPPAEDDLRVRLQRLTDTDLVSVDDAHLLSGTPVEDLLVEHAARHGARAALHVAAELEGAGTAFRGLVPQLARCRTAVVLQPGMPGDGAVVGARLPVGDLPVPGRGVLVHRGRTARIQVVAPLPGPGQG
ncbi:FtsK/SpoIIIE domain-containing protein [Ornithinimicrobium sufpigmenti]|uniref:FtsK/SpoIIIE domain-containing protein n=1 Tax=Ornithinimicrobium sufpigmenti TaxID=2508882 RepID=UPI001036A0A0|nr:MULTISPECIES: FtsK/SpoIIIE domain-containing protein [unclassified Ornithinimicrobium]